MKKLIAVSLLALHLFSLNAGLAIHAYSVYLSDRFFEKQAGLGLYNTHDLTEVKLPVNMPGITDWKAYESVSGEVRFASTAYNYVKIKVTRSAIYLLCVPNYNATRMCGQNIIHAENMNDIPVSKKEHVPFEKAFNLSTFNYRVTHYHFFLPVLAIDNAPEKTTADIVQCAIAGPHQPPELLHYFS